MPKKIVWENVYSVRVNFFTLVDMQMDRIFKLS